MAKKGKSYFPLHSFIQEHAAGFESRVREHRNSDRDGGSLAGGGKVVP